jgi:TRAP-type C4-dicarboxylate transport system permease small subunit
MSDANNTSVPDTEPDRHPLLRGLGGLDRGLGAIERFILGASILLMAAIMSGHVFARQLSQLSPEWLAPIFGGGIPGTFEIAEILIVLITFIGVSYGVRCARHISMSAIYDQLSGWPRKTLLILITVGSAALMFYLAWETLSYVMELRERGRVYTSLQLEKWWIYSALPIGFFLAGIQYLLTTVRNLTTRGVWRSFQEAEAYARVPDSGVGSGQV